MTQRESNTNRYAVQGMYAPLGALWDNEWYVIEEDWIGSSLVATRLCGQFSSKEAAEKAAEK